MGGVFFDMYIVIAIVMLNRNFKSYRTMMKVIENGD